MRDAGRRLQVELLGDGYAAHDVLSYWRHGHKRFEHLVDILAELARHVHTGKVVLVNLIGNRPVGNSRNVKLAHRVGPS